MDYVPTTCLLARVTGVKVGTKKSTRKHKVASDAASNIKGHLVEQVVARMYELPDVQKVETRVFLPTKRNPNRTREIDVLVTLSAAGRTIQLPIECKNEGSPIGAPKIDAFVGKLEHIGFAPQLAMYVSASGYTRDALERAQEAGISPFTLSGLTKDRLSSMVLAAFQSVVFVLLETESISLTNDLAANPHEAFNLYDEAGEFVGYLQDLIWQKWIEGRPPSILGEYNLEIEVPESWHRLVAGRVERLPSFWAKLHVLGAVITVEGEAQLHALVHAVDKSLDKQHVRASFRAPASETVLVFSSEDELNAHLENRGDIHLTIGRFRLPRISCGPLYWPPSERVTRKLMGIMGAFSSGEISALPRLDRVEVEGTDLSALWEPVWEAYPAYVRQRLIGMNGGYDPAEQDPSGWTPFFSLYHTIATCHAWGADTPQSLLPALTRLPTGQVEALLCRSDGKGSTPLASAFLKGTCDGRWSTEGEQFSYRVTRYVRGLPQTPLDRFIRTMERLAALTEKDRLREEAAQLAGRMFWRCADAPILLFPSDKPSSAPGTLSPVEEIFLITETPPTAEHQALAVALEEPRLAAAMDCLRSAATSEDLRQYYLHAFIRLCRWKDALDTATVILLRPDLDVAEKATVLARRGVIFEQMRSYDEAVGAYNDALELVPGHPELLTNRGRAYHAMGRYTEALSDYDTVLSEYPDSVNVLTERGFTYDQTGHYEEALADFNRSLELQPDYELTLVRRGLTFAHLGQHERAIQDYDAALEVYPQYSVALTNKGIALYNLQRYEESLASLDLCLKIHPHDPEALSARGNTYSSLERYSEAVADYTLSLELRPDHPGTLHNRAWTHVLLDEFEEALADYDRSLEVRPDHPHSLIFRGDVYDRLKRYEEALADYALALELLAAQPMNADNQLLLGAAYAYRGLTYYHMGCYKEAIEDFTEGFDTGFSAVATLGNRALAHLRLNDTSKAEADLDRLRDLSPEEPGTFYTVACFSCLSGKDDEALSALAVAIEGYDKYGSLAATDPDFDKLRLDPRFRKLTGISTE